MFARSDLSESPKITPTPPYQNRMIGAVVLLILIVVLVIMALGADAAIFTPYNAIHAVTQTEAAKHPIKPRPHDAPITNPNDQQVDAQPTPGQPSELS